MTIGVLRIELAILDAQSLKDKRRVVAGLKQRLRNRFNVSVAEVGHQDAPKRCTIAVCMVATEARSTHSQLDQVVELVRRTGGATLVQYEREML